MTQATKKWLIIGLSTIAVLVAVFGGTAIYAKIENNKAPEALSLSTPTAQTTASPADLNGTWTIGGKSQVGYRVDEILNGQNVTVVGRGSGVGGDLTIAGDSLTATQVSVDMTTLVTDNSNRDSKFLDILSTSTFPEATFTLTSPVDIAGITSGQITVQASGDLTIAGVTKNVSATFQAQFIGSDVEISTSIPVTFADYGITAPDLGFVKVEDAGTVELLLHVTKD